MKQFDEMFLAEIGATHLSKCRKDKLLSAICEELEIRVGNRMAEGLSEEQIDAFEQIIDNDADMNKEWLLAHHPNYQATCRMLKKKGIGDSDLINETASFLWLECNRPDYPQIVMECQDELIKEIIECKGLIFD